MKFRTFDFKESEHFYSDSGSRFMPEYEASFQKDGSYDLVKTGEKDVYLEIQAARPSCDLRMIIDRFLNKDPMLVLPAQREGFYADLSEMPQSALEWLQVSQELKNIFAELPASEKEKFGNNPFAFILSQFKQVEDPKQDPKEDPVEKKSQEVNDNAEA